MKTVVNDKTLSYFPYGNKITAADIHSYIKALKMCGTDYFEINRKTATLLAGEDLSESFILWITGAADLGYCSVRRFAYVVVPLCAIRLIKFIDPEQEIILEVGADEYSAQAMLMYVNSLPEIQRVSVIRLTGVLGDDNGSVGRLVEWYKARYFRPLDICPLNTMMSGVSDAISAYAAGADMITLSFGRGYYYSALEQFLVNVHILERTIMHDQAIKGICTASVIFSLIFDAIPTGLEHILDTDSTITASVHDIERGISYRPYRIKRGAVHQRFESVLDRKIKSIGLEREIEDAIIDTLKKVNFSFYKDITKRNIIE